MTRLRVIAGAALVVACLGAWLWLWQPEGEG